MTPNRKRSDNNQQEIVNELRQYGCHVTDTHNLGGGFPDLVVTWKRLVFLVEIKNNEKSTFTPAEKKFIAEVKADVIIATSFNEVIYGMYANIHNTSCITCRVASIEIEEREKERLKNERV